MSFRRIPVEFEINTNTGEVLLDGKRMFYMPVLVETYNALQADLKNALQTYLAEEMDTFAEDMD
jgi:hypothetical protein